jgi:hypothetical protein
MLRLVLSIAVLGSLVSACGGSATNEPSESAGAGASGSGGSGSGASGTGASGGGPDTCDYEPGDVTGPNVTVRLVNETGQPLYLGNTEVDCEPFGGFELSNANGPLLWQRGSCSFTCAEAQEGSCACAAGCAAPIVTMVADGASWSVTWPGTIYVPKQLTAECAHPDCGAIECVNEATPPAGELTLTATAYPEAVGCDFGPCTCAPDASGTCIIDYPATVGGRAVTATATISQVSEATVDIVFEALPGG